MIGSIIVLCRFPNIVRENKCMQVSNITSLQQIAVRIFQVKTCSSTWQLQLPLKLTFLEPAHWSDSVENFDYGLIGRLSDMKLYWNLERAVLKVLGLQVAPGGSPEGCDC